MFLNLNRQSARSIVVGLLWVAVCTTANAQLNQPRQLAADGPMQVVLIGTGIPIPNPDRGTAATLVICGDKTFLVDTGSNCVVGLSKAKIGMVSTVLFTHYHSDHIAGFGDVLVMRGVGGQKEPLQVIGPPGAKRVVNGFSAAYALDLGYRTDHHGEHYGAVGATAVVTEAESGVVYDKAGIKITMFTVNHDPITPAVGYRFEYQDKVVVISGDCKKTENMVEMSTGADVLVHEAMDAQSLMRVQPMLKIADPRRGEMLTDLMEYHTPTNEVAEIARDAGVKKLVLTHLVPSIPPQPAAEKNFVRGMAEIYSGPIIVGRDAMTIDLE